MMVMPSNNSSPILHYWAGRHPGKIGWLISPKHYRYGKFKPWIPYACDNDAYTAHTLKEPWSEERFFEMLEFCKRFPAKPIWVAVPDVVGNRQMTLENWRTYAPRIQAYGWPLAFVVQDGMTIQDIPGEATILFVGGSTRWKWRTAEYWAKNFPRIHIGRVNSESKLWFCHDIGAESIDGTGWFRGTDEGRQARGLGRYLAGERSKQEEFKIRSNPLEIGHFIG